MADQTGAAVNHERQLPLLDPQLARELGLAPPAPACQTARESEGRAVMGKLEVRLLGPFEVVGGGRWQMGTPRKRPKLSQTVATGCDQLPIGPHGKEGGRRFESVGGLTQKTCK